MSRYPNRLAARSFALAASTSRFRGGAFVVSEASKLWTMSETSPTARSNAASLSLDGFLNPLTLRMNWSDAAWISSGVAGGSKLCDFQGGIYGAGCEVVYADALGFEVLLHNHSESVNTALAGTVSI